MLNMAWTDKHILDFGKYKGRSLGIIADTNPGYIVWLRDEAKKPIDDELYNECVKEAGKGEFDD